MKKVFVTAFSIVLLLGLLAACSGGNGGAGAGGSSGSDGQAASSEGAGSAGGTSAAGQKAEEPQGPGKFSLLFSGRGQYIEQLIDINNDPYVLEMERLSNTELDIELIPEKDFPQKLTLMMSSGDIPDVVRAGSIYDKALAGAVQSGVFLELDDLLQQHGKRLLEVIPQEAWERVKYQGKIVGIPAWRSVPNTLATYIRKDFLEKAGISELPKTVDEYLNMLRAFKGIGVEYPMLAQEKFSLSDQYFSAYDVLLNQWEYIDGQVVPKWFKAEAMMQALDVYKTLLDEQLISPEFTTNNGNNLAANVYSNKHGTFMLGASAINSVNAKLLDLNGEGEFVQALAPVGPDGMGGPSLGSPVEAVMLVNRNVSEKTAIDIIRFFEWQVSEEGQRFHTYGIEGKTYTVENGEIKYELPTDADGINRQEFHQHYLWWVNEKSYQPRELLDPASKPVIEWMTTELVKEGRSTIEFSPQLETLQKNPDLLGDSDFMMERIMRMIYGQEPISNWPQVIEEWKKRGGNEAIKEATERYQKMDGVFLPIK